MSKIVGIDLGSTFSAVSVMEGGSPVIITNSEGKRTTPSVVGFTDDNERKIGDPARRQAVTNPKNTVSLVKRLIGEQYDNVKIDVDRATYDVKRGNNGVPTILVRDKEYTPQEISAMVLQKMKQTAEDYLGEKVTEAVITVPAYFGDSQRKATEEAGKIAGLNVRRIINEPTAAALAYGMDKLGDDKKIVVFDFGGGTHDVSILELGGGVFEVKAIAGDTHLGGDDIDHKIVDWVVSEFKNDFGGDLTSDPMAMQRVKEAAEKAKIELSNTTTSDINLPYLMPVDGVPQHFVKTLTRAKFEQMIEDIVKRTIEPCEIALKKAKLSVSDIDEVILVGGSTRIPVVQEAVKKFFGKEPNKSVNPDEAVAIGAAIQGAVLNGDVQNVVLLDVTPLSLGIETIGGVMTKLIDAGTTIPTRKSQIFSTAEDNQPTVEIVVCQGERPMAHDNKLIGNFKLDGIIPAKRGVPQIEVTFDIDSNGILSVSATDKGTGKEQHIKIEASSNLSDAEIERMKAEAKAHEEEDKKLKETADIRNNADSLVFSTDKMLVENADKLSDEQKNSIQTPLEALREELKNEKSEKLKEMTDTLQQAVYKVSGELYQQTNPNQGEGSAQEGTNPFGGANNPFGSTFGGANNPFAGK